MSILSPSALRACYAFLRECPPFKAWQLPDPAVVVFKVARDPSLRGWYIRRKGRHTIAISSGCIAHTGNLVMTMAHEMIHLYQREHSCHQGGEHNAQFKRLADRVCAIHGWDPKLF